MTLRRLISQLLARLSGMFLWNQKSSVILSEVRQSPRRTQSKEPEELSSPLPSAGLRGNLRVIVTTTAVIAATLALTAFALQKTVTAVQTARRAATSASQGLATLLPQGALLTISSPDFAALLHAWTTSPQSAAWLQSANDSVFQNSRLFSRLADAQTEFASTAKLDAAGTDFLTSIAGRQSIFAWYDVGNLEFLYITRLPPDRAAQTQLLQSRARFSRRQIGSNVFYIRTEAAPDSSTRRTVAFAISGDLLLLATREDLIANALQLIAHATPASSSLAREPWYDEASAAQPTAPAQEPDQEPALHMVLNLDRLVPLPYFRSYWVQQNITEMKQYRTAVADLYREPGPSTGGQFREERTLLLKSPPDPSRPDPDLAPLAALVPPGTGVFRALATSDPASALSALDAKLLGRGTLPKAANSYAPDADLDPSPQGSATDLETRIDTPAPVPESASTTAALAQTLQSAGLNAVLTMDSAGQTAPDRPTQPLWIPIHSAVVLRTDRPLIQATLAPALQQTLRGTLTAANLGIDLRPVPQKEGQTPIILTLSGPKPLFIALSGNLCLLANDQPLLAALLTRIPAAAQAAPTPATLLAAFNHDTQRPAYLRLTSLIDGASSRANPPSLNESDPGHPTPPPFFSGNIRSLSDAFSALQSETILTRHQGDTLHQTVTYVWNR